MSFKTCLCVLCPLVASTIITDEEFILFCHVIAEECVSNIIPNKLVQSYVFDEGRWGQSNTRRLYRD